MIPDASADDAHAPWAVGLAHRAPASTRRHHILRWDPSESKLPENSHADDPSPAAPRRKRHSPPSPDPAPPAEAYGLPPPTATARDATVREEHGKPPERSAAAPTPAPHAQQPQPTAALEGHPQTPHRFDSAQSAGRSGPCAAGRGGRSAAAPSPLSSGPADARKPQRPHPPHSVTTPPQHEGCAPPREHDVGTAHPPQSPGQLRIP